MISIDVRGLPEMQKRLHSLAAGQIPYATMIALNNTAFAVRAKLQDTMRSVFDRPTPWLLNQVTVSKATKDHLTAVVGTLEGKQTATGKNAGFTRFSSGVYERVLAPHIQGGTRELRKAEVRLQRAGILPTGWLCVPSPNAPLDQYGNLPESWWVMILSWLNALQWSSQGAMQNRAEKLSKRKNKLERAGIEVFAAIPGRDKTRQLHPGIYLRQRKDGYQSIHAAILFVRRVTYRARLDWMGVANATALEVLPGEIEKGILKAIETAR